MAVTVIFALVAAFVLSLTFIPAMVALVHPRQGEGEGNFLHPLGQGGCMSRCVRVRRCAGAGSSCRRRLWRSRRRCWLFTRLGQEFIPTLDEKDIAMHAMRIAEHVAHAVAEMQIARRNGPSRAFPEVAFVFSKTGTAEVASDPMPPNVSDTFIILKPRKQWRSEAELDRLIAEKQERAAKNAVARRPGRTRRRTEDHGDTTTAHARRSRAQGQAHPADRADASGTLPGNNYEFTQPIQMRFNELIAGVRGDVAVKVYGDDFDADARDGQRRSLRRAAKRVPARPT